MAKMNPIKTHKFSVEFDGKVMMSVQGVSFKKDEHDNLELDFSITPMIEEMKENSLLWMLGFSNVRPKNIKITVFENDGQPSNSPIFCISIDGVLAMPNIQIKSRSAFSLSHMVADNVQIQVGLLAQKSTITF